MRRLTRPSVHTLWCVHKKTNSGANSACNSQACAINWMPKSRAATVQLLRCPGLGYSALTRNGKCKIMLQYCRSKTHPKRHTQNAPQKRHRYSSAAATAAETPIMSLRHHTASNNHALDPNEGSCSVRNLRHTVHTQKECTQHSYHTMQLQDHTPSLTG
jgi:hypothetical protein